MSLQVDLGVDERHEEGGQDEGGGEESDGGQGGEGRMRLTVMTPGPEVGVHLGEAGSQARHQASHQPHTAQAEVGPQQSTGHFTLDIFISLILSTLRVNYEVYEVPLKFSIYKQ